MSRTLHPLRRVPMKRRARYAVCVCVLSFAAILYCYWSVLGMGKDAEPTGQGEDLGRAGSKIDTTVGDINLVSPLVLVGATSCLGYNLLSLINHQTVTIDLLEDWGSLRESSPIGRSWLEIYADFGLEPKWLNTTDTLAMHEYLKETKPRTIVYAPVSVLLTYTVTSSQYREKIIHFLKTFIVILELMRTHYTDTAIVLPLTTPLNPIQSSWMKEFELTASTYKILYNLDIFIFYVRNELVHEDKDDVAQYIYEGRCHNMTITDNMGAHTRSLVCATSTGLDTCTSEILPTKDVIVSTYFSSKPDPQRTVRISANSFNYMVHWFLGIKRHNLNIIIFHDNLQESWIKRVEADYSRVTFVKTALEGRSTNDARFYILWDYFAAHPEIKRVFLMDLSDIEIIGSPFDLMDIMGNQLLYIGIDDPFQRNSNDKEWMTKIFTRCFSTRVQDKEETALTLNTLYNAGIIGGSRDTMLAMFHHVLQWLNNADTSYNCNMGAVNVAAHEHFFEELFTGYPLQNGYKIIAAPDGLFLKHKPGIVHE